MELGTRLATEVILAVLLALGPQDAPSGTTVCVTRGAVEILQDGRWTPLTDLLDISDDVVMRAPPGSEAKVQLGDGATLTLGERSAMGLRRTVMRNGTARWYAKIVGRVDADLSADFVRTRLLCLEFPAGRTTLNSGFARARGVPAVAAAGRTRVSAWCPTAREMRVFVEQGTPTVQGIRRVEEVPAYVDGEAFIRSGEGTTGGPGVAAGPGRTLIILAGNLVPAVIPERIAPSWIDQTGGPWRRVPAALAEALVRAAAVTGMAQPVPRLHDAERDRVEAPIP